jgi:class 3 adenylate cyclase/tetratricopeptide (TPR) repeat protein
VPICTICGHDNREGAKFCEQCASPLVAAPAHGKEQRKTVTVLFCDLTGSTALGETVDPERLRALLARYFERMKEIVERHGGTVEKFIGDAVMAVFGVPVVHEDDALRAVRAAAEMRDALPALGLQGRIGVMTGEVVTGTEERLATGDAVNVAARLEQAAQPGEVLVGAPTVVLVGGTAEFEPVEPLELKGKTERVEAHRLIVVRDAPERRHETTFVGRAAELATVLRSWEQVQVERGCVLVTIVGDAGVGKSRLVVEALTSIDAHVVRGRCLPYGEGITYFPVVEILKQLGLRPTDEAASFAIGSLLGENDAPTSADEIAWAFRKTLEQAAADRPLVVVFDDIQWGEQAFLDLIEHIALLSSGASILLLCLARPELVEQRSTWPVTIRLEPLRDDDVAELMPHHIAGELREKIARAAGGNPLFIGEMLAMAADAEGEVVVPPTLRALLAARLDQLEGAERSVLERGSVEGEIFHRGAVQALAPQETHVTPRLVALVRKELIRPDKALLAGEDGFRFRHLLIRDAAYDALPKGVRAELHERFAAWLEARGADLVERDEVLGYHLEQACRYRIELGTPDDALAAAARARLTAAGGRARLRSDDSAAATLLERAASLVPVGEVDVVLESDLVDALFWSGNGVAALQRANSLAQRASSTGDRVGELCGRIKEGTVLTSLEPEGAADRLAALAEQALPEFEAVGNDHALYIAYSALAQVANLRGRLDANLDAYERASVHAQRAGLPEQFVDWRAAARFWGATHVLELLEWLDELDPRSSQDPRIRIVRAMALAMLGRFVEARALGAGARAELADRGGVVNLASLTGIGVVRVEILAGDFTAAVELGEESCRLLEQAGERGYLSTAAGALAQALFGLGRLEDADAWAVRAADFGASDDAATQMLWRQVRARVLGARGKSDKAERLAREAVMIGEKTDMLASHGDAYADLGEVLLLAGKPEDAAAALEQALERYERKGSIVQAERARVRLAEVRAEART